MSYFGHYDEILRLLENLCRSARISVVSRSQGILLKNESKYSLWHPYSQFMEGIDRENVGNTLRPSKLEDDFWGWTNFVGPILKDEMRKTKPTMYTFIELLCEHSWNYIKAKKLFRRHQRFVPPRGQYGILTALVDQRQFVALLFQTRWPDDKSINFFSCSIALQFDVILIVFNIENVSQDFLEDWVKHAAVRCAFAKVEDQFNFHLALKSPSLPAQLSTEK